MVSHRRLLGRKRWPRACADWVLDSGGFSELSLFGRWVTTPRAYRDAISRAREEIGRLVWAAPQDWMCEPAMRARTGGTIADHQARTIESVVALNAWGLPVIPVLQGWHEDDYLSHVDSYRSAGVDLSGLVGVGSVCRRQNTYEAGRILWSCHRVGLKLHAFGVKQGGLGIYGEAVESADSMAWSYAARRRRLKLPDCQHRGPCGDCLTWALMWRQRLLSLQDSRQGLIDFVVKEEVPR
jgi:hypothetical protein